MIGPSPSYVPVDFHDVQAALFSRGGYPLPPANGASNASRSTGYLPPPVGGNVFGSPAYAGQGYDEGHASPEQQSTVTRYSVSPRTGYEGWKDAIDSTYSGLPNDATNTSMFGAIPSSNDEHQSFFSLVQPAIRVAKPAV